MDPEQHEVKEPSKPESDAPPRKASPVPRPLFYAVLGLLGAAAILAVGLYAWRALTVRTLEQRLDTQKTELTVARQVALSVQARDMLRLTARPLGWAVRAEMLKGNLGQVDDYFREFVREPGVTSILLIDNEGTIKIATNRKHEGQPAEGLVSAAILDATDVLIDDSSPTLRLAVPIMSFSERLGILVLDYQPQDQTEAAQ